MKRIFWSGLRPQASASEVGQAEREQAGQRAGDQIIAASAKVVEVVTSPSAPRVNTFSVTNSPKKANRKKTIASGERRR